MAITNSLDLNSLEFATKFTGELDKVYEQESKTGFLADNAFKAKFVGARSVKIPNISLQGLADYDRDTAFITGTTTISNTIFTMQQDRGRSFMIDREDMDETGVAELAGAVMSEFVRTKVIPESDAYVLSKLASFASTKSQTVAYTTPYETFLGLLEKVQDACGYSEQVVCFVAPEVYMGFKTDTALEKSLNVGEFKRGEVHLKVTMIDDVPLIPVSSDRMKTAYEFLSGGTGKEEGGFAPTSSAKGIKMLMLPKTAAMLVKKCEKIRTFTPEQNIKADAYKFDYRLYYDCFVRTSGADAIWASIESTTTSGGTGQGS